MSLLAFAGGDRLPGLVISSAEVLDEKNSRMRSSVVSHVADSNMCVLWGLFPLSSLALFVEHLLAALWLGSCCLVVSLRPDVWL